VPGDQFGDFHDPSITTNTDLVKGSLLGLIDIAQEKNYMFIRSPVAAGNPNNIPAGTIYNKPDKFPDLIGIYVGSLDRAVSFKPAIVLYASRGHAWDFLDPDIPKLPEWYPNSQ